MCPPCAWLQVERWLAKQKARLLACDHDQVIVTVPHELNELWLANVEAMTPLRFASVHETRCALLGAPKYLGAKPGIIATLHPWTQTLLLHPHVHCLVTGGGLTDAGRWVAVRHGFLLPMRVVMAVFRGKLRAAIRRGVAQGALALPMGKRPQQIEKLLNKLGGTKWNVHIRERDPPGQGILVYLARDLRGGPLSKRRLLAWDGERVVLGAEERAKGPGGHAQRRTMSLAFEQFIGRWRLHGPASRAVLVRCWGLYAHTQGEAFALCRQPLGQAPVAGPEPVALHPPIPPEGDASCAHCPVCGQPLVCPALIRRAGVPPPAANGREPVA
jgi:hypothetical protein